MIMKKIAMLTAAVITILPLCSVPKVSADAEYEEMQIAQKLFNAEPDDETDVFLDACQSIYSLRDSYNFDGSEGSGGSFLYDALNSRAEIIWRSKEDYDSDCVWEYRYSITGVSNVTAAIETYKAFVNGNPQYFFLSKEADVDEEYLRFHIKPEYQSYAARKEAEEQIYKYVTETAAELKDKNTIYEKAAALHDKIVDNTELVSSSDAGENADNVIGVITEGKATSEGYANTFQIVMNYLRIYNNYNIQGKLDDGQIHNWNLLMLDDRNYYCIDCAADDAEGSDKYFASGRETVAGRTVFGPDNLGGLRLMSLPEASEANYDPSAPAPASRIPDDFNEQEFLKKCGSHYGYDFLGTMSKGKDMQKAYDLIYAQAIEWWNREDPLSLPYALFPLTTDEYNLDKSTFRCALRYFLFDNPQFFYIYDQPYPIEIGNSKYMKIVMIKEYLDTNELSYIEDTMIGYVDDTAWQLGKLDTIYEKACAYHDKLVDEVKYAHINGGASDHPNAHNVVGVLIDKEVVCEGYAKAFDLIMNYIGVDDILVNGNSVAGAHAWNMIKLDDGNYYFVDATWDDQLSSDYYLLMGSEKMTEEHTPFDNNIHMMRFLYDLPEASKEDYDDVFIEKCKGYYGYSIVSGSENGLKKLDFYRDIDAVAKNWWHSTEDYILEEEIVSFEEYGISEKEALEVYQSYRYDNPQYFFLSEHVESDSTCILIKLDMNYNSAKSRSQAKRALISYVLKTAAELENSESIFDKVADYHDKLIKEVDLDLDETTFKPSEAADAKNVIGAITKGKASTEGYAMTFHLIMNYMDIMNIYVSGTSGGEPRAWNLVMADDEKYYIVDCINDDLSGTDDFLLSGSKKSPAWHVPNTPDGVGEKYLYPLPEISEDDYEYYVPGEIIEIHKKYRNGKGVNGDINDDKNIDIEDAVMVINSVNGVKALSDEESYFADVDKNEAVDIEDAVKIIAYVNGVSTF